ncbi:guanylate-binding protein 1-like [Mercenaria mercenaria]|uniref:guanylate-binding protein 1-like n=1 Tax=Mercenaria mercenaria TaxID=6596 RepID=UPI00234F0174|nr:guanylate-binding protein 1-like [Mercenaria mercenaria]
MSKNIRFCNDGKNAGDDQLGLILPKFVLCIRDFSLELVKDGEEMTPDDYLEDCLEIKTGNDMERYNRPRECIRKYFPTRKCFTFDRPGTRDVMRQLESVPNEKLSEAFVEETNIFLEYMYTCEAKVLISSKAVNGRMLASLVETYVEAIRNGAIPDVDDAIMIVANIENERMADEAVEKFKSMLGKIKLPVLHTNDFEQLFRDMQKSALAQFRLESVFKSEKFEKYAISAMDELWEKTKKENLHLVRQHCGEILQKIYEKLVGEKMDRNEYKIAGGYPLYKLDMEAVKTHYKASVEGIDEYEAKGAMIHFMDNESVNEGKVMLEDQKMTEEDRKRELDRVYQEHKEAQESQAKLFDCKLEEERKRSEDHQRKMKEERTEYMKKQEEKMEAIQSQYDEQRKLSEKQIAMMREENEKQKEEFQREIHELSAEYNKKEKENKEWFQTTLQIENENAEKRIAEVKDNFNKLFDDEKKKSYDLIKTIDGLKESHKEAVDKFSDDIAEMKEEEAVRRQQQEQEYNDRLEKFSKDIKSLTTQLQNAPTGEQMQLLQQKLDEAQTERDFQVATHQVSSGKEQTHYLTCSKAGTYSNLGIVSSRKMTSDSSAWELDRVYQEHKEAQESQGKLFDCKLEEERKRSEETSRKIKEERTENMKKQEEKMEAIQSQLMNKEIK